MLPDKSRFDPKVAKFQYFFGNYVGRADLNNVVPQVWEKPKNASMLYFLAIGSGGGGGAGGVAAGSTSGTMGSGGGSGGGPATVASLLIPAMYVPPVLYVCVPGPNPGSDGTTAAWYGQGTMFSTVPNSQAANVLLLNSCDPVLDTPASPGGDGSSSAAGSGASGNTAPTAANMPLASFGHFTGSISAGTLGGGYGATPAVLVYSQLTAGGGGGGTSTTGTAFDGGGITSVSFPSTNRFTGVAGGSATGNIAGSGGFSMLSTCDLNFNAWLLTGGGGGASNASGQGGRGGDGGIGCGGGGGGGSAFGFAPSLGGNGGPGVGLVAWW